VGINGINGKRSINFLKNKIFALKTLKQKGIYKNTSSAFEGVYKPFINVYKQVFKR